MINMASNSGTSGSPASSHLPSPDTFSDPPSSNASPVSAPPSLYMGRASHEPESPGDQRTSISDSARPAAASVLRSHSSSTSKGGCWYVSLSVPCAR